MTWMVALSLWALLPNPPQRADVSALGWMAGCWASEGESASGEMWTRPMGNMLLGVGFRSTDARVVTWEFMRIEERAAGEVFYVATPSGQSEAEFKMTSSGDKQAVFENPAHDFPQRISHQMVTDSMMKATVEGASRGFELRMRRAGCSE